MNRFQMLRSLTLLHGMISFISSWQEENVTKANKVCHYKQKTQWTVVFFLADLFFHFLFFMRRRRSFLKAFYVNVLFVQQIVDIYWVSCWLFGTLSFLFFAHSAATILSSSSRIIYVVIFAIAKSKCFDSLENQWKDMDSRRHWILQWCKAFVYAISLALTPLKQQ